MLEHGADLNAVKELLGHAGLAATQVYTHNTVEKLRKVHAQAHPRGGGGVSLNPSKEP
jgi:integrase/recombinase XerC